MFLSKKYENTMTSGLALEEITNEKNSASSLEEKID
jgi:hypothetical protein